MLEPVDFNGVLLGETSLDDVLTSWGKPIEQKKDGDLLQLRYVIEPFAAVDVTFLDGKAAAIVVDLGRPFSVDEVAGELGINDLTPVPVEDEKGIAMGLIFPERAVSFRFAESGDRRQVTTIGLDQLDPRPFVLRAEKRIDGEYAAALFDLDAALKLDPKNARALLLKARIAARLGKRQEAMSTVEAALKLEPKSPECLLLRAALLAESGLFDAAQADVTTVVESTTASPHLQARAWCVRGDLYADGPTRDYAQALDAHTRAVRLAAPLVDDPRPAVRRAVREVLIEANLAAAQDIAWGNYQQKEVAAAKWLEKAKAMADAWAGPAGLTVDAKLKVYRKALTTMVGLNGAGDPTPWADELERLAQAAIAECSDPLHKRQLEWECGLGMYDALQSYHARGDSDRAVHCGERAVEWMTLGFEGRDETPTEPYRFGRLYFRVGSLYAIQRKDHAAAAEWFDRAAPLLERPLPEAAAADRGRQGETLVSIGVSYWAVGKKERAVELTSVGSKYMEQAIADGLLTGDALAVPYANLAAMHRDLGNEPSGRRYQEMATKVEAMSNLRR